MKKKQKNKTENNNIEDVNGEFTSSCIERKCTGCMKILPRESLIKITSRHDDKKIIINPDKKTFGRSVYLCYNNDCITKAFKKNKISRFLKVKVSEGFIDDIKHLLGEK